MKFRSAFVTGGAGLIGSHIVDQLLCLPVEQIVVFDNLVRGRYENLSSALHDPRVRVVEGDVRNLEQLSAAMQGADVVFHQAAIRIIQCAVEPRLALEVLVDGTFNVLESAVKAGVRKVIAASSASVYGLAETFPTTEEHHLYNNRTLYGAAKAFDEMLLRSFLDMYGLDYIALRYFNVYGPRMDAFGAYTEVLIRWMERIANGQPPLIFGSGEQTMDFVYVEDVARANLYAAQAEVSDRVFNVGTGVETSLNELAATLLRVMESDLEPEHGPERKVNPVSRRLADVRSARELIGFEAQVGLEEGMRRLVRWWREATLVKAESNAQSGG